MNMIDRQISIFDIAEEHNVDFFVAKGANYVICPENLISKKPIELGDKILYPGLMINELGDKERTKFSMQENRYLKYAGMLSDEKILLFAPFPYTKRNDKFDNCYYSFGYVDRNTLLVFTAKGGARDIRVNTLNL